MCFVHCQIYTYDDGGGPGLRSRSPGLIIMGLRKVRNALFVYQGATWLNWGQSVTLFYSSLMLHSLLCKIPSYIISWLTVTLWFISFYRFSQSRSQWFFENTFWIKLNPDFPTHPFLSFYFFYRLGDTLDNLYLTLPCPRPSTRWKVE